jgi:hypothetical protein
MHCNLIFLELVMHKIVHFWAQFVRMDSRAHPWTVRENNNTDLEFFHLVYVPMDRLVITRTVRQNTSCIELSCHH